MKRKNIFKIIVAAIVVGGTLTSIGNVAYAAPTETADLSSEFVEVASYQFKKPVINLYVGQSESVEYTIHPENATNKTLLWESGDSSVASVDQNGKITAVSAGSVYVTGSTTDGTEWNAACQVNVITDKADTIIVENLNGDINEYKTDINTINQFIDWYNLRCDGKGTMFFKLKAQGDSHYTKVHFEDIFHLTIK